MTTLPIPTSHAVEELKRQWLCDPGCWDLEDSDGFEAYHDELLVFRLTHELTEANKQLAEYRKFFAAMKALIP